MVTYDWLVEFLQTRASLTHFVLVTGYIFSQRLGHLAVGRGRVPVDLVDP